MRRDGDGFYKKLFALVLPMAFQNLMSALVSASDSLMLGFLAQDALSAAALAGQVQFVLNLFISALTIGETVLAAQYWGKGETDTVERVLAITMRFALLVSLVFFAAALCVPQLLMRIFTPDAALITLGADYLRVLPGRQSDQRHAGRRNLLRGRRYKIRFFVRCGLTLVRRDPGGASGGFCPEAARAGCLFYSESR